MISAEQRIFKRNSSLTVLVRDRVPSLGGWLPSQRTGVSGLRDPRVVYARYERPSRHRTCQLMTTPRFCEAHVSARVSELVHQGVSLVRAEVKPFHLRTAKAHTSLSLSQPNSPDHFSIHGFSHPLPVNCKPRSRWSRRCSSTRECG